MSENTGPARHPLRIEERSYFDFDAACDPVSIRRRPRANRLTVSVNDHEFDAARVASAFPLSARLQRVVFFNGQGEEIGCLKNPSRLDGASLRLLREELDKAYFMPRITAIMEIDDCLDIEFWRVETNRGERTFEVRQPRRHIRTIGPQRMVVKDVDGNRYEIRDWSRLDRKSLAWLMRHL